MLHTIHTKNLVKKYGQRVVVNNVSIEVKQGEIVGLLGPNGAGKTTTFYQVVGLIKPDEGKVYLDDEDITSQAMYKRAKMGLGYLPQEASVFRKLSVEDNITAILEMTDLSKQEQRNKLETLISEFRLGHVRKNNGDVLSGGERRRTEIARALAVDPKFILLDEPFAGIDPIAVEDIQAIVAKLKYKNIGILITDHNVTETLSICDRAYLLIEGKIYKHGTAEELAEDEEVRKLYLGRNFELKRKDYLHDEARELNIAEAEQAIIEANPAVLLQFTEHTIGKTKTILNAVEAIISFGSGDIKMAIDLGAPEYMKQLHELKIALVSFASINEHEELLKKAVKIPDIDYAEYKNIFIADDYATLGGGIIKKVTSLFYQNKLTKLKELLIDTDSILGTCAIYLKAF
jgi:lipopolysaccharide export system ATP-binding protein